MRTKTMIILLVFVLAALNYNIYEKDQIKEHGETLLLELVLVPINPRLPMQENNMRTHYVIERNAPTKESDPDHNYGYMVIRPDENNVAQFIRFYKEGDLAEGEKLIRFYKRYGVFLEIMPRPTSFQDSLTQPKYAVFKFGHSGKYMFIGLADDNRNIISPLL